MFAQENEEFVHIRPACAECTHRCNVIHGNQDLKEEQKFDPDRSWPHFVRKLTKMALHHSPNATLCIPGTFAEDYPNLFPKDKPLTLEGPSGNQWKVGAIHKSLLHPGWRAFAHDHHLREGDHLYFCLTKPSHFTVQILNSHGDVRRSARKAKVTGTYAAPGTPPLMEGHSKKRKVDVVELAGIGKNTMSNIMDRWNTPAKRGFTSFNEPAAKLRYSEETKLWESHEEKDGREDQVVTIDLDSDDEKTPVRSSKLGHFLGQVGEEEDEDFITLQSKAFATPKVDQKAVDAKSHPEITSDGEDDYVVQENEPFDEEEKQRPSDDPLRQFSNIFNTTRQDFLEDLQETTKGTTEKAGVKAKMEKKIESASDPLSRQAQILRDVDMVTVEEEEDEDEHSELDKTTQACAIVERKLETIVPEQDSTPKEVEKKHEDLEADKAMKTATLLRMGQHSRIRDKVSQSYKNPLAYKAAAADNEPVTAHNAVDSSPVPLRQSIEEMSKMYKSTENSKAEDVNGEHNENPSPGQMQEEEGGFSFALSPDNDFEYPVVINSIDGDQTDSKHPLKQGLKQAGDEETLIKQMEDDEQDLIESKASYSIFEAHELDVTMTEPGTEKEENPNMPVLRENVKEKETVLRSNIATPEFTTPEKEKNINIQARVASTTNTCVLESKRWKVFPFDQEKALKQAQAWVKKIRNPNFIAVMKNSQVYTDFIMDIPADFAKHSNLPSHEVRVTLVCDEVPTNCKALWLGSQSQLDCKGWRNFSRSHCLEEGDVCVFECFPPATPTMASIRLGVYIFRVVKLTRPIVLDWARHYKVLQGDNDIAGTANGSPSPPPLPSPAQAHTPSGANQAYEAYSKEKRSAGLATL